MENDQPISNKNTRSKPIMNVGVIPARLESTRFPRKILFPINDRPMVVHVYEQALKATKLDKVIVAVDSEITATVLNDYNIDSIMTSPSHQSGTHRISEATSNIAADIIVNLQADEPLIEPELIDQLVECFVDETTKMATLVSTLISADDLNDPNTVKVKVDNNDEALGFYRQIDEHGADYLRHIGIYAYRRETLKYFTKLKQTANEKKFRLEQLRALDNGVPIKVIKCDYQYRGIDTPEDLKQFNYFTEDVNLRKDQ